MTCSLFFHYSDDEAYIPCNNRAMRDHQMEPDGDGGAQVIREDPPESKEEESVTGSKVGGSRLKQMAIKKIEEKSPNRSLASKLAAKRATLLSVEALAKSVTALMTVSVLPIIALATSSITCR